MVDVFIATYSLSVVWLLGFLFLRIVNCGNANLSVLSTVPLDFGVGAGLLYALLLLSSVITGQLRPVAVYLTILTLTASVFYAQRNMQRGGFLRREDLIGIISITAISLLILLPSVRIGIEGDGWAIWAFKAKAFFEDGMIKTSFLMDMERYAYSHPDYPLLFPLLEYWAYAHLGHINDHVIRLVPITFWILMMSFFYSTLLERIKTQQAVLSTTLLALIWPIAENAMLGLVDVVQAFYNLVGIVYLFRWLEKGKSKVFWTAALIIGFGANVKNEGSGFLVATIAALFLSAIYKTVTQKSYERLQLTLKFSLIGAIISAPWIIEKRIYGIKSELFSKGIPDTYAIIDRIGKLGIYYLNEAINIGYHGWGLLWVLAAFAFFKMICCSYLKEEKYHLFLTICLLQFLMLVGVYTITPYDLNYHLQTSGNRTLLQIVPAIFWICLVAVFQKQRQELSI